MSTICRKYSTSTHLLSCRNANLHQSVTLYFNFELEKSKGGHVDLLQSTIIASPLMYWTISQIANPLIYQVCQSN